MAFGQRTSMSHRLTGSLFDTILLFLFNAKGTAMLNAAHCAQINSAIYTHEYDLESQEDFTGQFERDTGFENGVDIGGLIVYMRDRELLAFFDYENAAGAVFKMPWMA